VFFFFFSSANFIAFPVLNQPSSKEGFPINVFTEQQAGKGWAEGAGTG